MSRIDELIEIIYDAQLKKDRAEEILNNTKGNISLLDTIIEESKQELLSLIDNDDVIYCTTDENKLVRRFHKTTTGYTNENDVIKWLKDNSKSDLIKVKTTESLNKNELKKQLKSDTTLQEGLKPFILNGTTDYVVVTDKDNYEKMLEHINEGK